MSRVYTNLGERHPEAVVIVPPRATAVPSQAVQTAPTQRDRHHQEQRVAEEAQKIGIGEQFPEILQPDIPDRLGLKLIVSSDVPVRERHHEAEQHRDKREREKSDDVRADERQAERELAEL